MEVMQKYYVYFHVRSDTKTVFYIGKGSGKRVTSKRNRNDYWHNIVNAYGYEKKIVISGLSEQEALDKERYFIKLFKTFNQAEANILLGGNTSFPQGYTAWNKGISPSVETRQKITESLKGNIPWNKGKTLKKEHISKLSESHKGLKGNHVKPIIDTVTGTIYNSVKEAALSLGIKRTTLNAQLSGQSRNKTNLKYL